MDPLHLCIALGPLAVYLLLLGTINLMPRPLLTSGARDTAALAIALTGLVIAGPMELFYPESAAEKWGWGPAVWLLLLGLYGLGATLLILMMRPRLVIYNMTLEQLRPVVAEVAGRLDADNRRTGDTLLLPKLHVQLCVESHAAMRNIQLVSVGPSQSHSGWRRLERELGGALANARTAPNPYGISFLTFAVLLLGVVAFWMVTERHTLVQALRDMLRLAE